MSTHDNAPPPADWRCEPRPAPEFIPSDEWTTWLRRATMPDSIILGDN